MKSIAHNLPLLALIAAALGGPAQAGDYEIGTNLVCDTQVQVERFEQPRTYSEDTRKVGLYAAIPSGASCGRVSSEHKYLLRARDDVSHQRCRSFAGPCPTCSCYQNRPSNLNE
jgi:hypothetical protein